MLLLGISFEDIADAAINFFILIGIHINAMIYNIATFLFDIFISIISATIFNTEDFEKIANSIYLVIGVVALFIVSYALLRAIVDPDGASKSNYAVKKIVPNILIAVILIAFVPFIFSNAYKLQGAVVRSNIIPNVIFGRNLNGVNSTDGDCNPKDGSNCSSSEYVEYSGRMMANDVFLAFFVPTQPIDGSGQTYSDNLNNYYDSLTITNCWLFFCDGNTLSFREAQNKVKNGEEGFGIYAEFADWMHGKDSAKNKLEYNWLLQLISGVVLVYVLVNFCIDMAVRVVKLGYFQIIAPIPILTIMIPGQKKIFDNWMKQSIQTFLDVFLRIFIIFMGILLINMLPDLGDDLWSNSLSPTHPNIARAFIMIGILIFMKQAPKLIADIFGISSGSFKLGIADKLGEMALVGNQAKSIVSGVQGAATGSLGAGWTAMVNRGKIGKAALLGGLNGAKKGGNQFNKQRKYLWEDVYGMKGPAGWFGGRPIYNKTFDELKNTVNDQFLQYDESKGLGTNSKEIRRLLNTKQYRDIEVKNRTNVTEALSALTSAEAPYQSTIDAHTRSLNGYQTNLDNSNKYLAELKTDNSNLMSQAQNEYVSYLKELRNVASKNDNLTEVASLGQQIQEAMSGNSKSEIMDYLELNNRPQFEAIQKNIDSQKTLSDNIDTLEKRIQSIKSNINDEMARMNADQAVISARTELNKHKFYNADGSKIDEVLSSSDISQAILDATIERNSKDEFRKANDEYAWRVAAEEKERNEVEIKKAKKDPNNQALADLVGAVVGKMNKNDDKK